MSQPNPDTDGDGRRIKEAARKLAAGHSASRSAGPAPVLLDRLPALEKVLHEAYAGYVQLSEERGALSGVGEWLLDNFYVVLQGIRQIRENMPPGYYARLPKLEGSTLRGYPRIYALARCIVQMSGGHVDVGQAARFVRAYQDERALTMGEIWALPTMLRLAAVEVLTQAVSRAVDKEIPLEEDAWPDPLSFHGEMEEPLVAAAIKSLRAIDAQDWEAFFEATSLVERTLREEPAGVYPRMDFDTRDRYRGVIEELARRVGETEQAVAEEAMDLAGQRQEREAEDGAGARLHDDREAHVGFYLVGEGLGQLEEALGYRGAPLERLRRAILRHPTPVYLGSITVVTLLMLAGALLYAWAAGAAPWSLAAVGVLGAVPASMVGVNLVNVVATRMVSPRVLPKLDLSGGIPDEYRTMVVVPALLTSNEEVDFLARQLELHYLGNADDALGFALLSDFADAPEKHLPEDERLLEAARTAIRQLNQRYGTGPEDGPFYLFHRERLWNPSENQWMGWERKRGKLVEFNRLLRKGGETSYVVKLGDLDFLTDVTYVITLDADTVFPLDAGHRLIGTLAHPLNRAEFAEGTGDRRVGGRAGQRVLRGYTVLQPRTEVKATAATQSRFTRVFAGDAGLDLYTRAVSDVYQDLFGEGVYTGKGIYDVEAFERSLRGRVPENALLSHDLFEGIHGRAGLVSDVVLFEDYPPTYLSYAQRKHRWVRGDWQILPWLLPRVPLASGGKVPNSLSLQDRWKIFDNLRRSLRSPAMLALLIAGWLGLPGSPWVWTLMVAVVSGLPLITGTVRRIARRLRGPRSVGEGGQLGREVVRWLLNLAFLPYESILMVDAIGTSLVRLLVSRQRLLQWTTAAHTVKLFGRESRIGLLWRRMRCGPVVGLLVAAALGLFRPGVLPISAPLILPWLLSPFLAAWIGQSADDEPVELASRDKRRLRHLARRTWLYFERFVGPEDHWLPPDHYQEEPRGTVAHRTSPTNIGMTLLSTLGAWELGYVSLMGLMLRISDTFDSLDELERYRGHFLNWYDTRNLSTLSPRYVSTVDSGNLAAALMALAQGLEGVQHRPVLRWERWRGLCDTLGVLREVVGEIPSDEEGIAEGVSEVRSCAQSICDMIAEGRDEPENWVRLLTQLETVIEASFHPRLEALLEAGAGRLDVATLRALRLWSERIHFHLSDLRDEVDRVVPWMVAMEERPALLGGEKGSAEETAVQRVTSDARWRALTDTLSGIPRLDGLTETCRTAREQMGELIDFLEKGAKERTEGAGTEAQDAEAFEDGVAWCRELDAALERTRMGAGTMMIGVQGRMGRAQAYVQAMDFGFLYDAQRDVFHIGYRTDTEQLDENHYDLLASEARIASLVAIGQRQVPQRHWLHLGRPMTEVGGLRALLSWGGSMFEYLMPDLLMRNYDGTLLSEANRAAVRCQMAHADARHVPWGVSESGYYRLDGQQNYQYRGFGVPGLGRKRGLGEDLVVAPYASLLAVSMMPGEVLKNVEALAEEGMLGPYGLYEALDYTETRLPMGQTKAIVRSYMVHHQGMILTALVNYLTDRGADAWFHRDPRVESVEFLLQEQVPRQVPLETAPEESLGIESPERERVALEPWSVPTDGPMPQVHVLSNGRYGLLLTEAGGGYSTYVADRERHRDPTAITRWRADTTQDCWGLWIYVQDRDTGALWSVTEQPRGVAADEEQVRFYPHKVEYRRRHGDISLHTEVTVAPEEDVEIRRVTLTNHSGEPRRLRVCSYGEVVLADQDQDRRHPAFNKMFIESEYDDTLNAMVFTRRPRSAEAVPMHVAHALVPSDGTEPTRAYDGDRRSFVGRGRSVREPLAMLSGGAAESDAVVERAAWLSGSTGSTLDPIMALGQEVTVGAHATARVAYLTAAGESREDVAALARRYGSWSRINRAFERAHTQSEVELRNKDLEVADLRTIQRVLSVLVYPHRSLRAAVEILVGNRRGQSALWPLGISGDYPIVLVRIDTEEDVPLVRELLRAHAYWRDRQLRIDLVILNERDVGYAQELNDQLHRVIRQMDSDAWVNRRGGIFVVRADRMEEPTRVLLATAARAVFDAGQGDLKSQVEGTLEGPPRLPAFTPGGRAGERELTPELERPSGLQFDNGVGGFTADGAEYVIYLESGAEGEDRTGWPPAPWINVMANPSFGCLVSETGLGYSWAENSGENRLTPWRNDPVSDQPAEAVYLRDEETAEVWTPTPQPAGDRGPYVVRHRAGRSVFEHNSHGLEQELGVFVDRDAPVKVVELRLRNTWKHRRRLTATFYAEWVLGINRDRAQQTIVPRYDPETGALLARNPYSPEFDQRVAFVAASKDPHGVTADRTEFLGRRGSMEQPAALGRVGLASRVEPGLDPCAALQIHLEIDPGETEKVYFLLGQGQDAEESLGLIRRFQDTEAIDEARGRVEAWWDDHLGMVTVDTPDPAMDVILNRWLPYQALSCRVWGRSALYQSSGAFGFRDQLQDVMSLLHAAPELAREHILRAARHQFEEGDVLHWWHPPSGRGVRTRISDDLLWLPYVTAEYVEATGDEALLEERVSFRKGEPLDPDEEERYGSYELTEEKASVYEHCLRALERGTTSGPNGLPLIGAGDWNDGLNRVGIEGEGESVWLGWFLYATLSRFADLCARVGETGQAEVLREQAGDVQKALEESAWDGNWYIRAVYGDGTPLGSSTNEECQIASMAQSWAVLSGAGDPERTAEAMEAVAERLVHESDDPPPGLIHLFTPPFDETPQDPGYIKGYPPGIRENGGQYTHAALWAVWAYTEMGQGDRAGALFQLLNPVHHSDTGEKMRRYGVEPYVVAADVYSGEGVFGRGGWTWYTGSSGWMVRLGIEAILGLRRGGDALWIEPCIPSDWPGYRIGYRFGATTYRIEVENPEGSSTGIERVSMDGKELDDGRIPLEDDGGEHHVVVKMG